MKYSPCFQFYPSAWLSSRRVLLMTPEEKGAYMQLLCHCWVAGSIPKDPQACAVLIGKGGSTTLATVVQVMFQPHPNDPSELVHDRLEQERAKQARWREKSAEGGKKSSEMRNTPQKTSTVVQPPLNQTTNGGAEMVPTTGQHYSSSLVVINPVIKEGDKPQHKAFIEPSKEELTAFAAALTPPLPPLEIEDAYDFYKGNGWKQGRNLLKDWKCAIRRWNRKYHKGAGFGQASAPRPTPRFALVKHRDELKRQRADLPTNGDATVAARHRDLTAQIEETDRQIASTPL